MQNKSKKHRKHIFKMILSECSVNKVKLGKTFAGDFLILGRKSIGLRCGKVRKSQANMSK